MDKPHQASAPPSGKQRLAKLASVLVSGVCVGVVAAIPQMSGYGLVAIQSLAAGAMLSVILVGSCATFGTQRPRWPAALAAAAIAVIVQHVWLYSAAMANRRDAIAKQPAAELFRPGWSNESFYEYIQNAATPSAVGLWALDACLLALATVVIVEVSARRKKLSGR